MSDDILKIGDDRWEIIYKKKQNTWMVVNQRGLVFTHSRVPENRKTDVYRHFGRVIKYIVSELKAEKIDPSVFGWRRLSNGSIIGDNDYTKVLPKDARNLLRGKSDETFSGIEDELNEAVLTALKMDQDQKEEEEEKKSSGTGSNPPPSNPPPSGANPSGSSASIQTVPIEVDRELKSKEDFVARRREISERTLGEVELKQLEEYNKGIEDDQLLRGVPSYRDSLLQKPPLTRGSNTVSPLVRKFSVDHSDHRRMAEIELENERILSFVNSDYAKKVYRDRREASEPKPGYLPAYTGEEPARIPWNGRLDDGHVTNMRFVTNDPWGFKV